MHILNGLVWVKVKSENDGNAPCILRSDVMGYARFLVFRIDDRKYAVNLVHVNGTEQEYSVSPLPEAPFGITGVINLRGDLVPVYSLRKRFGKSEGVLESGKTALIARTSGIMIAYEVDNVESIEELDEAEIRGMPQVASNAETSFMNKVIQVNNEIIVVIDVNQVLSNEAIEALERIIKNHVEAEKKALEEQRAAELLAKEELAKSKGKE